MEVILAAPFGGICALAKWAQSNATAAPCNRSLLSRPELEFVFNTVPFIKLSIFDAKPICIADAQHIMWRMARKLQIVLL
jgi:hypothetical protein